jgi:hypothetical protein
MTGLRQALGLSRSRWYSMKRSTATASPTRPMTPATHHRARGAALRRAETRGFLLVVVTNQPDVAAAAPRVRRSTRSRNLAGGRPYDRGLREHDDEEHCDCCLKPA